MLIQKEYSDIHRSGSLDNQGEGYRPTYTYVLELPAKARTDETLCTCRIQNPNIPRAVRVGAAHGGAARRGGTEQNRTPKSRVAQKPTLPLALQGIVDNCSERPFASKKKGFFNVNGWRNKTRG